MALWVSVHSNVASGATNFAQRGVSAKLVNTILGANENLHHTNFARASREASAAPGLWILV